MNSDVSCPHFAGVPTWYVRRANMARISLGLEPASHTVAKSGAQVHLELDNIYTSGARKAMQLGSRPGCGDPEFQRSK